jgi:hypothetical protein
MKHKNIDGYVKISGSNLNDKVYALLLYLQKLNAQLAEQDIVAQAEFDVNRGLKIVELDAYRDSGKAWRDYSVARVRNVLYEPITWFKFIRIGDRTTINIYGMVRSVEDFNYEFWTNIDWDVLENLTPDQLSKYSDYRLPYQAEITPKHDLTFLEELMLLVSEPEIYLGIADYQKLVKLWAEHFEGQELLVG